MTQNEYNLLDALARRSDGPSSGQIKTLASLLNHGRYTEGEAFAHKLTLRFPRAGSAWKALGVMLKLQGRNAEALEPMQKAADLLPSDAEAHINLGITFQELGRPTDAEAVYRRALKINPDYAEAYYNLGNAMYELGRLEEAEAHYRRALETKPVYADAYYNLGITLHELGRLEEAEASYRLALEIKPDYTEAYNNLGNTLKDMGRLFEAEASYRRALEIKPDAFQYAVHAHLMLPIIIASPDESAAWWRRYNTGIETLKNMPGFLKDPAKDCNPLSFYLAYHNRNDRSVMTALNRLFRERVPELTTTAPHIPHWLPPAASGRRIRVGFISEFLVGHTIGKLYQGYISHLDRSRFEVVVIQTPKAKRDTFSQRINAQADKSLALPINLAAQRAAIAAEKLDILFYPDIGMARSTYFLAYARLAPVQAVSWGHPDTTGLDTIDYFVSATSIEPEDADEHYSEKLIRLNRLPCYYQPWITPPQTPTRSALGLPETGTLYGCPQSLFKFHPEFDAVLAAIAEGDPIGHIVLLEGKYNAWTNLLRARWGKHAPILLERVLFLPRMPLERFMDFIAHIDVLLDTVHFGSGNTLYEGMVYGTPIVTWPGRFMRGRIVAGAYRQMGVADAPIAARLEEYAPLALALGRDPERRQALRQASLAAADRELFADTRAVRELESFLEAAVAAAGRGEKLPTGWRPDARANDSQQEVSA